MRTLFGGNSVQCANTMRFWSRYYDGIFFLSEGRLLTMKSDLLFYGSFFIDVRVFFSSVFLSLLNCMNTVELSHVVWVGPNGFFALSSSTRWTCSYRHSSLFRRQWKSMLQGTLNASVFSLFYRRVSAWVSRSIQLIVVVVLFRRSFFIGEVTTLNVQI